MAAKQDGVVTRGQAVACGLSPWAVRRRVASGALEAIGATCLRPAGQPGTVRQLLTVGLLDLGEQALVAGRAAAHLLGLDGFVPADPPTFLVPRSLRERTTIGPVRSSHTLPLIDRVVVEGFACTSASRTIVDLMGEVTERELEDAVDSALRLGWTSEAFLRRRFAELRRRGLSGTRALDRVLDGAGGHSRLERTFLELVGRAGLPRPTCQRIVRAGGRFVARTDFTFEGTPLVCEVAGHATHASRRQRQRDEQRRTELQLLGALVLTFTYEDVAERPAWVLGVLRQLVEPGSPGT